MTDGLETLRKKGRRLATMSRLLSQHAGNLSARRQLLMAYASTLRTTTSKKALSFPLRIGSSVFPFHMRRSDVFVLEEVLLEEQYVLQTPIGPGPTIVDAGANIGITALWFIAHYPGARLYALEPEPENFRLLSVNVGHLENVCLEPAAVGACPGIVALRVADHDRVDLRIVNDRPKVADAFGAARSGRTRSVRRVRVGHGDQSCRRVVHNRTCTELSNHSGTNHCKLHLSLSLRQE